MHIETAEKKKVFRANINFDASNRFLGIISSIRLRAIFVWISQNHLSIFMFYPFCTDFGSPVLRATRKDLFFTNLKTLFTSTRVYVMVIVKCVRFCSHPPPALDPTQKRNISHSCKTLKYVEGTIPSDSTAGFGEAAHFFNRPSPRDTGHKLCN